MEPMNLMSYQFDQQHHPGRIIFPPDELAFLYDALLKEKQQNKGNDRFLSHEVLLNESIYSPNTMNIDTFLYPNKGDLQTEPISFIGNYDTHGKSTTFMEPLLLHKIFQSSPKNKYMSNEPFADKTSSSKPLPSSLLSTTTKNGISNHEKDNTKRYCSIGGCFNTVQSRGLCKRHGGGQRCKEANCQKSSKGGGYCIAHGGGRRCLAPGCGKSNQRGGYCIKHGGNKPCIVAACTRNARTKNLCRLHGGTPNCQVEGCTRPCRAKGYCSAHYRSLGGNVTQQQQKQQQQQQKQQQQQQKQQQQLQQQLQLQQQKKKIHSRE